MLLKTLRFMTIILTALSAGLSFAHLLELPPRVFYFDAQLWVATTTRGLYALFGTVGAVTEIGSILTAIVLALLTRGRGTAFYLALAGAILLALAFVLWVAFVAPVNAELAKWTTASFPADWARYRDQWEYTHAANAVIKIIALSLLTFSVVVETPGRSLHELPVDSFSGPALQQKQESVHLR
ncbi:MAG: hypothetical protein WCF57_08880 [Pyrinomonadaceae bacterium]